MADRIPDDVFFTTRAVAPHSYRAYCHFGNGEVHEVARVTGQPQGPRVDVVAYGVNGQWWEAVTTWDRLELTLWHIAETWTA